MTDSESSSGSTADGTPYDESILLSLRRITRAIDMFSRELARRHQLTGPQLVCLRCLAHADGLAPSELASAAHLSRATITGILDRLEKRDLVERVRSKQDRRRLALRLTETGRSVVEAAPRPLHDRFARRLAELGETDQRRIDATLRQVTEMMEAPELPALPAPASLPPKS